MLCQVIRYQANKEIVRDLIEEVDKGVKIEYERRARLSALEREADDLYKKIQQDVFLICCPGCKTPFIDFSGCFSVTCHCGCVFVYRLQVMSHECRFCGWCLKIGAGGDAHACAKACGSVCAIVTLF